MSSAATKRRERLGKRERRETVHSCGLHNHQLKATVNTFSPAVCTHSHTQTHVEVYSSFPTGCPDEVWWRRTRTALWLLSMVCFSPKICLLREGGGRNECWPGQGATLRSKPSICLSAPALHIFMSCLVLCCECATLFISFVHGHRSLAHRKIQKYCNYFRVFLQTFLVFTGMCIFYGSLTSVSLGYSLWSYLCVHWNKLLLLNALSSLKNYVVCLGSFNFSCLKNWGKKNNSSVK